MWALDLKIDTEFAYLRYPDREFYEWGPLPKDLWQRSGSNGVSDHRPINKVLKTRSEILKSVKKKNINSGVQKT